LLLINKCKCNPSKWCKLNSSKIVLKFLQMLTVKNNQELMIFHKWFLKVHYLCNKTNSVLWGSLNQWLEITTVRNHLEFQTVVLHKVLDLKKLTFIVYMSVIFLIKYLI
jgi:hypothetical protein